MVNRRRSSKLQIPSTKLQRRSKSQAPKRPPRLEENDVARVVPNLSRVPRVGGHRPPLQAGGDGAPRLQLTARDAAIRSLELWCLEFPWSLDLGIWSFIASAMRV